MDEAKPCACDTWQGLRVRCCGVWLVVFCQIRPHDACVSGSGLGWPTGVGESPVREYACVCGGHIAPSSSGLVESAVNQPGPPGKPKYSV